MEDKNYHTIDPLILETLNLNERRMEHIFDILHGRDPVPYTKRINTNQTKLPKIIQNQNMIRSPRQATVPSKKRTASLSMINSPKNNSILFDAEEVPE